MKRSRLWFTLILITSAILLIGASADRPPIRTRRNQHQIAKATTDGAQNTQPEPTVPLASYNALQSTLTKVVTALHAEQEVTRHQPHLEKDWWDKAVVIADFLLVIVGLLYAYFAWGQWSAINESVRIATKSLLLQFRPRLIVRHIGLLTEPNNMLVPDEAGSLQAVPIEIVLTIANRGGAQGEIIDQNVTVQVVGRTAGLQAVLERKPFLPQFDKHSGRPVYGGDPVTLQERVIKPGGSLTIKQVMPVEDNIADSVNGYLATHPERNIEHMALVAFGYFKYRDELANSYMTAFCRRYDRSERRFVVVDNPDYEYSD